MTERPAHKRSKSSRLLGAIRGDSSNKGDNSDNDSPTSVNGPTLTSTPSSDPNRLTLTPTNMTMASTQSLDHSYSHLAGEEQRRPPPTGLSSTPSIEDSVRTFKVFEALRSKDPAAISRAIQESSPTSSNPNPIPGTTILHLAIQCAEPQIVDQVIDTARGLDFNSQDRDGNTPLHLAAHLGRASVVNKLLEVEDINDALLNRAGKMPIDLARTPEIFSQLQLARSLFLDATIKRIHEAVGKHDYKTIENIIIESRAEALLDVNALQLATDQATVTTGGTLLHEAARKKDLQLAQLLLLHGADPFRRDRKGKLPQDVTKDEKTRSILKRSPAAAAAQRGIQEKAILGTAGSPLAERDQGKESREMKGYLKKWTNYTSGYKLRWFVLEDSVLSYYKHQDDAGTACRGAINMRIARLHMDSQDKTRFEIHGKSSVKYHLKANHVVEAKRWFWALNNAIQFTKDEAKEEADKKKVQDLDASKSQAGDHESISSRQRMATPHRPSFRTDSGADTTYDSADQSVSGEHLHHIAPTAGTAGLQAEGDVDGEDASSHEMEHPGHKDAFNITAQSAKLQLDLLARVSGALKSRQTLKPETTISDPDVVQAFATYETSVSSLNGLVGDLLKIARDREAYWQYRLERDADARKMWEESMAAIAYEHEDLKKTIAESEDKRRRTKRALKEALEGQPLAGLQRVSLLEEPSSPTEAQPDVYLRPEARASARRRSLAIREGNRRKSVIAQYTNISDSESGDDDEFFDAIDAGDVEVVEAPLISPPPVPAPLAEETDPLHAEDEFTRRQKAIITSYKGYSRGIRTKLALDADNRPKISLWGILKSMIGKDMTKMTLPVSFNEPTSLLYRVVEDMEFSDLLDIAADRNDSLERLVYVAGFAISEYASTIGRVAKPFNPLLGETYEYVRPDKGYRFFAEQVSHHPPIGAAYAEAAHWDYYGESAVKTKFLGKSFDANPLGTWFCHLRPRNGAPEELYTWKKVTSSVIGIITGNPTIDNYGPMEVRNWTTGEVCILDFKQRGWKASSAYHVSGKIMDNDGVTKWSIGGRWNDKVYARVTEGFEDDAVGKGGDQKAILVWQASERPAGIPFNLTPFVVTLNDVNDELRPWLAPTDSRLRPDQRAMEDGEYDLAAVEKNRVEEKQRAARRLRENAGEEWKPQFFSQRKHPVTGEPYWHFNGEYWTKRDKQDWSSSPDIFSEDRVQ